MIFGDFCVFLGVFWGDIFCGSDFWQNFGRWGVIGSGNDKSVLLDMISDSV